MKLSGVKITGGYVIDIVIPRQDDPIVLRAQAIMDFDEFERLCPEPQPPIVMKPGDKIGMPKVTDPEYLKKFGEWAELRILFMYLKSLSATEGLEWETIKMDDPATWKNFEQELTDAGLSAYERARVYSDIAKVNCMDEDHVEAARKNFLAGAASQ